MNPELRAQLIDAMEATFEGSVGRIDHAKTVLGHAETILANEPGDETVVVTVAILHDIGVMPALKSRGESNHHDQEVDGPPMARAILEGLGFAPAVTQQVCDIIAHHHNGQMESPEFSIMWDADWLVNFPGYLDNADAADRTAAITKIFRTETGAALARELFLPQD
jgi:hypothetical protein